MDINDTTYKNINQYLDVFYFEEIWNSIYMENRINMKLISLNDRVQTGNVEFRYTSLKLPDNDPYFTYYLPIRLISAHLGNAERNTWVKATDIIDSCKVHLMIFDKWGRMFPLDQIWFYLPKHSAKVIIVLNKLAMYRCNMDFVNGCYITLFNDINRKTPMDITGIHVPPKRKKDYGDKLKLANDTFNKYRNSSSYTRVFLNGINYRFNEFDTSLMNDEDYYIEFRCDKDVDIAFNVEVDENNTAYYSDMYKGYREIIHIPKALNPDNIVYTHNVITFYVRDNNTHRGVYYHRIQPTTVRNITHNDLSLDRDVINAFKDALGATQVSIDVCIRTSPNARTLVDEKFCIRALYEDTDENIIRQLRGEIDKDLHFWKASELEQSGYIALMYHNRITDPKLSFDRYVNSFGVYNIGNILTKNHVKIRNYIGGEISLLKSYVLYKKNARPFVFVDGKKLFEYQYGYENYDLHCNVFFTKQQGESMIGKTVVVALYPDIDYEPQVLTPVDRNLSFKVPSNDLNIFKIHKLDKPIDDYEYVYDKIYDTSYVIQKNRKYDIKDNILTFDRLDIGNTYLVTNRNYMKYLYYDITDAIMNHESIILFTDINIPGYDTKPYPILNANSIKIFLNGYMLTKDIDYSIETIVTDNSESITTVLHIGNKNFLNLDRDGKNEIEIYFSDMSMLSNDVGYQEAGYLRKDNLPNVWYAGIDWCVLEGEVLDDFMVYSTYVRTNDPVNGKVYFIFMDWLNILNELLESYDYGEDQNIQKSVVEYYNRVYPITPNVLKIDRQHSIYSTYITSIIMDIRNHKITPFLESSDSAFLQQFDKYAPLIKHDVTLNDNNHVDRLYVSVGGTYDESLNLDETNTKIVRKLINLKLFPSRQSVGVTYL